MEKEKIHVGTENISSIPQEDPNLKRLHGIWSVFGAVKYPKLVKWGTWLSGIFFAAALIIYICLGATVGLWDKAWPIFILFPVIPSLFTAIGRAKPTSFLFPFLAVGLYCALGVAIPNFWHPGWTMLFSIILYYVIVIPLDKHFKRKKLEKIFKPETGMDQQ